MISRRDLAAVTGLVPLMRAGRAAGQPTPPQSAGGAAGTALPVPPSGRVGFQVLHDGDVIGTHELAFARLGEALVVTITIDIVVHMLRIPVYRYSHRATERWQGGRLMSIESRSDKDGSPREMHAVRGAEGLVVEGTNARRYVAPDSALPTTYWNRAMLQPQVISSEDGVLLPFAVTEGAIEPVAMASGQTQAARHVRVRGALNIDLWYDAAGQWAHLEFTKDNFAVVYQKL